MSIDRIYRIYACPRCDGITLDPIFGTGAMETCFLCLDCDLIFRKSEAGADEVSAPPEDAIEVGTMIPSFDVDTD